MDWIGERPGPGPEEVEDTGGPPASGGETPKPQETEAEPPAAEAETPAEKAAGEGPAEAPAAEAETPVEKAAGEEPAEAAAAEAETPVEKAAGEEPAEAQAPATAEPEAPAAPAAEPRRGGLRHYVLTAAVSAAVLLFALVFFMAGFVAHALLDEDDGGGGGGGGAGAGGGTSASASADDPAWGSEDAAVTIEEFSDFQCPFCKRFSDETLPQIRDAYGDKVRFIYRDYPLTAIHQFAQKAAEAGQCAHEQELFWEYHDLLFANQDALTVPHLKGYAEQVGADTGEFNDCLDSDKNAREVLLDMQDGQGAGVSGTPGFLVDGLLVSGAKPFEQFQLVIDQALAAEGE